MNNIIELINLNIKKILDKYEDSTVKDAMEYSLMAGGKRVRPAMMLEVIHSYNQDYKKYIDIACAIEMIHTYSLIHDDLPGMDNDDLRRGQPTCHKKYDEAIAILAGDSLLNEAVNIILDTELNAELKIKAINLLYSASGLRGMIYGQQLDIQAESKKIDLNQLNTIHKFKTGALISASLMLGSLIASENDIDLWQKIGYKIGLAFQIQDDILDVTGDIETLGKNIGSDINNNKATYVSLIGLEESQNEVNKLFKEALELLYGLNINHGIILGLFESVKKRVN